MALPLIDPSQLLIACASVVPDDLSQHPLLAFYQHHLAANSPFNLTDHVAALSVSSQLTLLSALDECLLELLGRQQHTAAATSESQHAASLCLIDCVITLVQTCLPASPSPASSLPPPLLSCLQQLHDSLLTFQHTTASHTQHRLATLLTTAYTAHPSTLLPLLPFLLPYLLLKCLEPSVRRSDIVALHSLRSAFAHFDYADETSSSLVQLLARAAVHPPLLRSREGRQLLAAVWRTSGVVGEAMHAAVKEHCVTGRRSLLEHYGDVYYRVWKESDEESEARQLCEGWLQQLMHLCLHCSPPRTHQSLLQLLHVLHSHRKQRDVELLLACLYEPLLFRALSAAHPLLRLHALSVLVDVFPLCSLDAEVPQETHIAQQMQALLSALSDAYAPSRAVAVRGICLMLSLYWELFSAEVKVDTVTAVLGSTGGLGCIVAYRSVRWCANTAVVPSVTPAAAAAAGVTSRRCYTTAATQYSPPSCRCCSPSKRCETSNTTTSHLCPLCCSACNTRLATTSSLQSCVSCWLTRSGRTVAAVRCWCGD